MSNVLTLLQLSCSSEVCWDYLPGYAAVSRAAKHLCVLQSAPASRTIFIAGKPKAFEHLFQLAECFLEAPFFCLLRFLIVAFHFLKCLGWERSGFTASSVTACAALLLFLTALPFTAIQRSFLFHFLPPVGRAWSEETAPRRWKEKVIGNAAVHLGDCTEAPVGIDSSRVQLEIASELHPQ